MTFSRLKSIAPYFFITAIGLYMFRGIFSAGFMSGYDNSVHYSEAYYLINTLIPKYHWVSGWTMQAMAGCPILLYHPQTGFLLIAVLSKFLPLILAYKTVVLFTYIFFGAAFYKISSYRFGRIPAFFIAVCLMLQKDLYHDRILQGIWNNFLGIGLFFLFFHMLDKYATRLTVKRVAAMGLVLGLTVPTHLFAAIFSFLIYLVYLVPYISGALQRSSPRRSFSIYMAIPFIAFAISLYYLQPFILAQNYFSGQSFKDISSGLAWSIKAFFGPIEPTADWRSVFINLPVIARVVFGIFGLYVFLRVEKREKIKLFLNCVIIFTVLALILFSDILSNIFGFWKNIPLIGSLQTNRFLIYVQVGPYLFAAYGVAKALEGLRWKKIASAFLLMILAPAIFFHYTNFAAEASRTLEQSSYMPDARLVWDWVNKNVSPAGSRVMYQNTVGNINDPIFNRSDLFALSGIFTNVPQVGVFLGASGFPQERYVRTDNGIIFDRKISVADASYFRDMMNYFNASCVVAVEPALKKKLEDSTLFLKKKEFGPFSIFCPEPFDGKLVKFARGAELVKAEIGDQYALFDILNDYEGNTAYVKISYHPFWRAFLNGRAENVSRDRYGLMKIPLAEKGELKLKLLFKPVQPICLIISLIGLVSTIGVIIFWKDTNEAA